MQLYENTQPGVFTPDIVAKDKDVKDILIQWERAEQKFLEDKRLLRLMINVHAVWLALCILNTSPSGLPVSPELGGESYKEDETRECRQQYLDVFGPISVRLLAHREFSYHEETRKKYEDEAYVEKRVLAHDSPSYPVVDLLQQAVSILWEGKANILYPSESKKQFEAYVLADRVNEAIGVRAQEIKAQLG